MQYSVSTRTAALIGFWGLNSGSYFVRTGNAEAFFGNAGCDVFEAFGFPWPICEMGVFGVWSLSGKALVADVVVAVVCCYLISALVGNHVVVTIGDASRRLQFSLREIAVLVLAVGVGLALVRSNVVRLDRVLAVLTTALPPTLLYYWSRSQKNSFLHIGAAIASPMVVCPVLAIGLSPMGQIAVFIRAVVGAGCYAIAVLSWYLLTQHVRLDLGYEQENGPQADEDVSPRNEN